MTTLHDVTVQPRKPQTGIVFDLVQWLVSFRLNGVMCGWTVGGQRLNSYYYETLFSFSHGLRSHKPTELCRHSFDRFVWQSDSVPARGVIRIDRAMTRTEAFLVAKTLQARSRGVPSPSLRQTGSNQ